MPGLRLGRIAGSLVMAIGLVACQSSAGPRAGAVSAVNLDGAAPSAVLALLGEPELRRSEPPTEIWQYRTERCVADIYLRQAGGPARVVYMETRSPSAAAVPSDGCLQDIANQRPTGGGVTSRG